MVEQKYTSLQEEHQRVLRKSRESVNSTRDVSTADQLQELDLRYQAKVHLCRKQVSLNFRFIKDKWIEAVICYKPTF